MMPLRGTPALLLARAGDWRTQTASARQRYAQSRYTQKVARWVPRPRRKPSRAVVVVQSVDTTATAPVGAVIKLRVKVTYCATSDATASSPLVRVEYVTYSERKDFW